MNKKPETVKEYLRNLDPDRRKALEEIRKWIKAAVPGVQETMRYGMPTYETSNVVCAMASQKG